MQLPCFGVFSQFNLNRLSQMDHRDPKKLLQNRTLLVTAAATRTGGAIARHCLELGARVFLNYLTNQEGALKLVEEFGPQRAIALQGDVTDLESVQRIYREIAQAGFGLDGLINVVGDYHEAPVMETSLEDYHKVLRNNLDSVFLMCKGAFPLLKESPAPRVVNFAYAKGDRVTSAKAWAYHIAKMGVISLSRTLAKEWGPDKISVNVISPGTLFNSIVMESPAPEAYIPQGRFGEYADLWPVLEMVLAQGSEYLTGSNLVLSGGYNV